MIQLPINCEALYCEDFLTTDESAALFSEIIEGYDVTNKVVTMADGSEHVAETGAYMFADAELTSLDALPKAWGGRSPWPDSLAQIRDRIEKKTGTRFQVARSVYYRNGSEGMGFHRDLPAYGPTCPIASISLGAEREFVFRPLDPENNAYRLTLRDGSLLLMGKYCQDRYEHGVPRCEASTDPRINLTFRRYETM